ncbi:MAG: TIGR04442 family protein [Desulfuromonadales bacterium]|nr:TIGR04442 family protein [Desulfuromonadales bacterium]
MHKDIRLHGQAREGIEYYVMVVGTEAYQRYFFNIVQEDDQLRIFSPGNEFIIDTQGISHLGNGGYFCEYMFGVDLPTTDLTKPEIINRLVMYGGQLDETGGAVRFSDQSSGSESYDRIFFDGNAVCNYFFFVHSPLLSRTLRHQQEELVRQIGKSIKRSTAIGEERDDILIEEIFPLFKDAGTQLFIIKLINCRHNEYRNLFRQLYFQNKKISDEDFNRLVTLAAGHQIDRYQQERIRIDVMYRHPANKRIVDEYRNILLSCNDRGIISNLDNARLTRLKTLSVRNKLPGALFYTLDEMLKKGRNLTTMDELDYLSETRQILEGIFLREKQIESRIDREDMLKLIRAKKCAMENRDHSFDQLMLDASKECDEKIRDGADPELLDGFSYVITYLDRFDSVANLISNLAFMENVRINDEILRGLLEHKAAFDNLQDNCFRQLFIRDLFENAYLGRFGRRKVQALMDGLEEIEACNSSIEALSRRLLEIDNEERISLVLLEHVRDRIRNFYSRFSTKADQQALRREVTEELKTRRRIETDIPDHLFNETIFTIKKEAMYLHTLLPAIISECNVGLREDFLENSGLDRFYVEELEREYYEKNGLDLEGLYQIRKGLS